MGNEEAAKDEDSLAAANLNRLLSKVKERAQSKPSKLKDVTSKIDELKINESSSHINKSIKTPPETSPKKKKFKKRKSENVEDELNPLIDESLKSQAESSSEILHKEINKLRVDDDDDLGEKEEVNQDSNDAVASELFPVIGDFKFKRKIKVSTINNYLIKNKGQCLEINYCPFLSIEKKLYLAHHYNFMKFLFYVLNY